MGRCYPVLRMSSVRNYLIDVDQMYGKSAQAAYDLLGCDAV
jgi:hypothetical protein